MNELTSVAMLQTERDAIACLGLLAAAFVRFDAPIIRHGEEPTHTKGLNIHAAVIDNVDGELLALEENRNHAEESPFHHAELRALHQAIQRLQVKRPRNDESLESYYKSTLFMGSSHRPDSFLNSGSTLYTTLEPCPMCTSSILACRMKRTVYLLTDFRFGSSWLTLKDDYFPGDESTYQTFLMFEGVSKLVDRVRKMRAHLHSKSHVLRFGKRVKDTFLLDHCHVELREAYDLLRSLTRGDLITLGDERNARTLNGFLAALSLPEV